MVVGHGEPGRGLGVELPVRGMPVGVAYAGPRDRQGHVGVAMSKLGCWRMGIAV